ncbi:D-alanyl-D-alanine carboxypeptidase [Streptomyces prasinosporus]|uniref:serine-type D-Ala-D-Ala carboxypeptidase n=1 Tax=Streptomyces prasinosporus TaxID=68256 RepID=A0ABP6TX14_9ACTN
MAGESPDSSKQRESSEEPTSGSAGPVPEARDSTEKRDPRLAVAREAASSGSRGSVDTATRVLSVRAATEDTAEGDAEDAPEDGDASSGGRDASAAEDDGRLREAVATWVRPAGTGGGTSGAVKAGDGAEDASADADAAADGEAEADGAGTGAEPEDRPERASAGEPEAETEDEDEAADTDTGTDTDAGTSDTGTDASRDTGAGAAPAAQDGSGRAAGEPGTADEAEAEDGDGDGDGTEDAAAETPADAPESAAAPADEPREADDDPEDEDEDDDADPAPDSPEAEDAPAKGNATDTDAAESKDPVDQPTAVFRTGRPSAPPVDQPTTLLKLGDAPAGPDDASADGDGGDGGDGGDAGSTGAASGDKRPSGDKGESESERTSRFVALKEFDDPGTRRPQRGGDATTALRAVTPAARPPAPADATASVPQVGPERTTQQPLPPKPPLDLLAELTNTPPPPETPLRTAVRRVKIWTPLVLLLVIVFAVVQNMRPLPAPTLELTARDGYTFEGGKVDIPWPADGQAALDVQGIGTFGSSGEQKPVPIASVAKVMTAYLILRDHPLESGAEGPMLKIDELAEKQSDAGQESTVTVTAGDEISQREAIEAILIASANNVARLLARWDAGSEKAFVEKMNAAAKDLGMSNTTYTDPSGLNDTTVSTAVDQVKLAKAAMKQPAFREVAAMMSYDDYKGRNWPNWNQLVGSNGVVGIKTGTTTSALGNLVFAAKKEVGGETRTIVGAVVRQPAGGKDNTILSAALTSGDRLIRAAQGALESATILKKGDVVGYVDDGLGGRTPVAVTEDVKAIGWAGLSVRLTFAADEVPHRAKAGTKVGTLTVGDGTSSAVKVPVALQQDLVEPGFTDKLTRLA